MQSCYWHVKLFVDNALSVLCPNLVTKCPSTSCLGGGWLTVGACQDMCSNCLNVSSARRCCDWSTYACALLLRLKSIVGCSRNTSASFLLCSVFGNTLLMLLYNQSTWNWKGVNFLLVGFSTVSAPFDLVS